jgi:hypothetical protein
VTRNIFPVWQFYPSGQEWLSLEIPESQILFHGGGDMNRSEVSANATFLAKLSNKEIYFKNGA